MAGPIGSTCSHLEHISRSSTSVFLCIASMLRWLAIWGGKRVVTVLNLDSIFHLETTGRRGWSLFNESFGHVTHWIRSGYMSTLDPVIMAKEMKSNDWFRLGLWLALVGRMGKIPPKLQDTTIRDTITLLLFLYFSIVKKGLFPLCK